MFALHTLFLTTFNPFWNLMMGVLRFWNIRQKMMAGIFTLCFMSFHQFFRHLIYVSNSRIVQYSFSIKHDFRKERYWTLFFCIEMNIKMGFWNEVNYKVFSLKPTRYKEVISLFTVNAIFFLIKYHIITPFLSKH